MPADRETRRAVLLAALTAGTLIAFQMGAKATRDALFLSHYDVTALPAMVIASAAVSLALAFPAARWLTAVGPGRLVPATFLASAVLLLAEWQLLDAFRRPVAVAVYLHYGALGALLISGFWSLVNERFDPRTAKRQLGRIAAAGTVGGLLGGALAERVAVYSSIETMLPILATLHVGCGALAWTLRRRDGRPGRAAREADAPEESGMKILAGSPYLHTVVALVFVTTMAEGLLDWVFKARATETYAGEDLLRLFAIFYTGVALITVAVQAVASRRALQRFGLARTVASLPGMVAVGSLGAIAVPGLVGAAGARGAESVVRHGLYRPAYELLFTAIPPGRKRPIKALVDVGVVRLGDIGGGALVQLTLLIVAVGAASILLAAAAVLSLGGIALAIQLHRGYVRSLERSLMARADQVPAAEADRAVERTTMLQSTTILHLTASGLSLPDDEADDVEPRDRVPEPGAPADATAAAARPSLEVAPVVDKTLSRIAELRSRDVERVQRALAAGPLRPELVPHVIHLLAWEPVMGDAMRALRDIAERITGQLVDHLLDPDEEFTIRRRIPLVLATVATPRAFNGLFHGLDDRRFEVRYRCGQALVRLRERNPDLAVDRERVILAILREVDVDRGVWESHRLLDAGDLEDEGWSPVAGAALRERANRSLEHVFTLLALILPREPLAVAFRALHTRDTELRGTALEYLETALPGPVREQLWPFLEEQPGRPRSPRDTDEVLRDLMRSSQSIERRTDRTDRRDGTDGDG